MNTTDPCFDFLMTCQGWAREVCLLSRITKQIHGNIKCKGMVVPFLTEKYMVVPHIGQQPAVPVLKKGMVGRQWQCSWIYKRLVRPMLPNFFKTKETKKQSMTCEFRMQLFIFGMAAILIPLWFGDSMQGQSLG